MEKIRQLTEEEKKKEIEVKIMKVSDTDYYFWICHKCKVAFFKDDEILVSADGNNKCLNKSKKFFNKTIDCNNAVYSGSEKYFNENYKILTPR